MRADRLLLLDIVIAARAILDYVEGMTFDDFSTNRLVQGAVIREFLVIGEAARRLNPETKAVYPSLPWTLMVGMRNQLIHGYFSIDLDIVWTTIQRNLIPLIAALKGSVPPEEE